MILLQGAEIIASFLESLWGIWIYARIKNREVKWKESMIVAVILTIAVSLLNQIAIFSFFTSILGVFLIAVGVYFVYRESLMECIAVTGIYMTIILIIDFFSLSVLGYLLGITEFADLMAIEGSWQRILLLLMAKVLLFLCCYFLPIVYKKIYLNKKSMLLLVGIGIFILYFITKKTLIQTDAGTLAMWIYLVTISFLVLYVLMQKKALAIEKEKNILAEKVNTMSDQIYKMYAENQEKNRIFYHDLKNQFILLQEYLENQQYQKAKKHMESLQLPSQSEKREELTGIEVLDILITYKASIARLDEIQMNVDAEPVRLQLEDYEIVALFGNLLDNAIEACMKIVEGKRKIQLSIHKKNEMIFVKVSNTYKEIETGQDGFVSQKRQGEHGIGLSSIRSIVEKYGGTMQIEYDDSRFSVRITFFSN